MRGEDWSFQQNCFWQEFQEIRMHPMVSNA
jgi:hypothetical protein